MDSKENNGQVTEIRKDDVVRVGCEVFVTRDKKLLLGKRKNCYGAGSWALPGGHLKYGEKMIEAAKREVKEELDIDAIDLKLAVISDFIGDISHHVHVAFLLENYRGDFKLMEPDRCEEWRFFDLVSLPENIFNSHQDLVTAFREGKTYLY
ncbi:MAG: NUDIX domain-containing protein [bacterium]|nr:NUDIX domain-containing protein [bacterium]